MGPGPRGRCNGRAGLTGVRLVWRGGQEGARGVSLGPEPPIFLSGAPESQQLIKQTRSQGGCRSP